MARTRKRVDFRYARIDDRGNPQALVIRVFSPVLAPRFIPARDSRLESRLVSRHPIRSSRNCLPVFPHPTVSSSPISRSLLEIVPN